MGDLIDWHWLLHDVGWFSFVVSVGLVAGFGFGWLACRRWG